MIKISVDLNVTEKNRIVIFYVTTSQSSLFGLLLVHDDPRIGGRLFGSCVEKYVVVIV